MSEEIVRNPKRERAFGAGFVLALHIVFTALTWVVGTAVPLEDLEPAELMRSWIQYLGLVQGVYVIPAALTIALLQRWQMLVGVGVMAGITAAVTFVQLL